jgi:branched-chain amino acid transport system substrate-binding protein
MRKSKALLAILGIALVLAACAPITKPVPTDKAITIAVVGPMSGELATFGEKIRRGAEMAIADINATGGVLGRKLELVVRDDQCDPPTAARIARELVAAGVAFVDGHFCSGSSIPASKVYGAAGILQITPASTNPALTEEAAAAGLTTILRTVGRDDRQGATAADWLRLNYSGKKVAILDDTRDYGREINAVIERELAGSTVRIAIRESFGPYERNFVALAMRMKAEGIEAIYLGAFHAQIAAFVKALRQVGSDAEVLAPDALNTAEFWEMAGSASNGVRYTDSWDRFPDSAKAVIAASQAKGYEPDGYVLTSYAAVEAFAAAARERQSINGPEMAAWLKANPVATVWGDVDWDWKGDLKQVSYAWWVWKDGRATIADDQ